MMRGNEPNQRWRSRAFFDRGPRAALPPFSAFGGRASALLGLSRVLVLEARFRFDAADDAEPTTVAHVVWAHARDRHPIVRPSFSLQRQPGPATILVKLQYLLEMTAPDSFARLQALHSRFWSFIDVSEVMG